MAASEFETLSYTRADNGVVRVAIDVPGREVNVLTPELHREIGAVAERLAADEAALGAVIYSAKPTFLAGGDLNRIVRYYDQQRSPEEAYRQSRPYTESLRKLETCGKPVAVAVNGTALGGGLELALAGHFRVVSDDPKVRLGLPEVTLGLLPGGGGSQRLPRLIGLEDATRLILGGKPLDPQEALELGMVDALAPADELLDRAERWLLDAPVAEQPWDRRGFRVPGGSGLNEMNVARLFQVSTARISAKYRHNYPAPIAALRCLFNGTTVRSMDAALRIETREFSALTRDPVARNIIRTLFIHKRERKFRRDDCDPEFAEHCTAAYVEEGRRMLREGIAPALIENIAWAAGMPRGPLDMAGEEAAPAERGGNAVEVADLRRRLLAVQSLAAVEYCASGRLDPVDADLNSVLGWEFPSYTGGVMSYIDTMGIAEFLAMCERFAGAHGAHFAPPDWLRERAAEADDRIYPVQD